MPSVLPLAALWCIGAEGLRDAFERLLLGFEVC